MTRRERGAGDSALVPESDGGGVGESLGDDVDTTPVKLAPGNSFLMDVWVNFKRWNVKSVRNPFVVAPTSRTAVFLGETLSELLRITVQVVLALLLGYAPGVRIATGVSRCAR